MSFLGKLGALLRGQPNSRVAHYDVRCRRCGEVLRARVNLRNELSIEYDSDGQPAGYSCRKVLIGSGRCFQAIEVILSFDAQRRLVSREVSGGEFVGAEG